METSVTSTDASFYIYLVKTSLGKIYTGISTNPKRRVREHNTSKRGSKALRGQRPVELIWVSSLLYSRSEAQKIEYAIKRLHPKAKERLAVGSQSLDEVIKPSRKL